MTVAKILVSYEQQFLYTLVSSGARVGELSSIPCKDAGLHPASIHLTAEITKRKVGRTAYINMETAEEIKTIATLQTNLL